MPQLHLLIQGQVPLVVLSHALGCDLTMWDGVSARLQQQSTVLRYDHRGHGRSPPVDGACTVAEMADDAAGLTRAVATVHEVVEPGTPREHRHAGHPRQPHRAGRTCGHGGRRFHERRLKEIDEQLPAPQQGRIEQTWVMMELLTKQGASKVVQACSYPLTGAACVKRIYTDLATLACTPQGLQLIDKVDGLDHRALEDLAGLPTRAPETTENDT